jgi:hypothetical protein
MASEKKEEAIPFLPSAEPGEDFVTDIPHTQSQNQERRTWWIVVLSVCVGATLSSLLWLVVWGFLDLKLNSDLSHSRFSPVATPTSTTNCGSSYAEATANNCSFQLWSYSWVPADCFDNELNDEFLALRAEEDWHYYSSRSPPVQVSLESVLTGTRNDLWSTWGQHFWHCAYYQRKFFRIVDQHHGERTATLKMTNRDLDEHHAKHCQEWLANPRAAPWDEVRINLTVGYHSCS